jgi:hypothetical protein
MFILSTASVAPKIETGIGAQLNPSLTRPSSTLLLGRLPNAYVQPVEPSGEETLYESAGPRLFIGVQLGLTPARDGPSVCQLTDFAPISFLRSPCSEVRHNSTVQLKTASIPSVARLDHAAPRQEYSGIR